MPSKRFPNEVLLIVVATLFLSFLLRWSDFSGDGWENLRPNLLAEFLGMLLTLFIVERYLRWHEKKKWSRVEKYLRERILIAMHSATSLMEHVAGVEDKSSGWLEEVSGNNILPLPRHHVKSIREELIPKVDMLAGPQAKRLYKGINGNLGKFIRTLDYVVGHHSQRLTTHEMEGLLEAHRRAGYLRNQLGYCLALERDITKQGKRPFEEACKEMSNCAKSFLQALIDAEQTCVAQYEESLETRDR